MRTSFSVNRRPVGILRFSAVLGLISIVACGESASDPDMGNQKTDAGVPDMGSVDMGGTDLGVDPSVPILERPSKGSYDCTQARGVTGYQPPNFQPEAMIEANGELFLLRSQGDFQQLDLIFSSVELDGSLGSETSLSLTGIYLGQPSIAERSGEYGLVWREADANGEWIVFARLGAQGQLLAGPTPIGPTSASLSNGPRIIGTNEGFNLLWVNGDGVSNVQLTHLRLDQNGGALGAPVSIADGGSSFTEMAPSFVRDGAGGAVSYSVRTERGMEVFFVTLNDQGQPRADAQRVSRESGMGFSSGQGSGFGRGGSALLFLQDHYYLAFSESFTNEDFSSGYSVLRLAVLNESGVGPVYIMQSSTVDLEHLEPRLFSFRDSLALMWSTGTRIYICAGCVPDNDLKMVLLDPMDLAPVSNVGTHPMRDSGLLVHSSGVLGNDILTLANETFHVTAVPVSMMMRCE